MKVQTRFIISAADPKQFPAPSAPEVAFLGRSNVGKSSLINALVGDKIAKTSNTPGRTQTINFFELRRPNKPHADMFFVDLPGYGYARVPKAITSQWSQFINPYLESRQSLVLCLSLVDISVPPQQIDLQLQEFLRHHDRPYLVVATKADRISNNQLHKAVATLSKALAVPAGAIVPFSAKSTKGHTELWRAIQEAVQMPLPGGSRV
ncbi:MAG TPA: ribosome biogenesis GTP-binding protein YihA/YsxC [Candidatus Angelobacter sp.]|nr:ribosome biogenesis GTP-binding protein YihA/YsxC [Candidatus Angelobacter sp.]